MGEAIHKLEWVRQELAQTCGLDLPAGRVRVLWDQRAAATPLGRLPYLIEFLHTSGLWRRWLDDCPLRYTRPNAPGKQPYVVRGDKSYGSDEILRALEERDRPYVFKLRMSKNVQRAARSLWAADDWSDASQGWEARRSTISLLGWKRERRIVVLRGPLKEELQPAVPEAAANCRLRLTEERSYDRFGRRVEGSFPARVRSFDSQINAVRAR